MATYNIGNRKHLTLADRAAIEHGIQIGENFSQIARKLNKDSSTISKEIRRHIIHVPHYQDGLQKKRSECQFFHSCDKRNVCGNLSCRSLCFKCRSKRCAMYCRAFTPVLCDRLKKPPYVCNNCNQIRTCSHDFYFYRAHYAHDLYNEIKVSSRSGINQTPESLEQLDQLVSPFLLKGQPLSHIYASNQHLIDCSIRTLYNYIDHGYFTAINLDLPRKVRYKKRRKTRKAPENTGYRENRTYHHFEKYLEEYPDTNVVELDVVEGAGGKSEKVLLTMLFRNCNLSSFFCLKPITVKISGKFSFGCMNSLELIYTTSYFLSSSQTMAPLLKTLKYLNVLEIQLVYPGFSTVILCRPGRKASWKKTMNLSVISFPKVSASHN